MSRKAVKKLGRVPVLALLIIVVLSAVACGGLRAPVSSEPAMVPSTSLGTGLTEAAVTAEPVSTAGGTASSEGRQAGAARYLRCARDNDIRFGRISLEQGLSQSVVEAILQDDKGFMWFGTEDGLNRYDGYEFVVYTHDPETLDSLSDNWIWSLYEDQSGVLWIGTNTGGLNRFDRETDQFMHYQNDPNDPHSLSHNAVRSIHEDREGVLWIGTWGGGLNRFDRDTEQFIRYQNDVDDPHSLSNGNVFSIHEDQSGVLWIGTDGGGLNRFDRETEQFTR